MTLSDILYKLSKYVAYNRWVFAQDKMMSARLSLVEAKYEFLNRSDLSRKARDKYCRICAERDDSIGETK